MELFETILHSFANLSILLFEYIGVIVITFAGLQGLVNYIRREPRTRLILAKGLAMGLEFKLGSEILRTVIIRNLSEIYIVAGIIALRAVLTFLIHWEIKNEEKEALLHKQNATAETATAPTDTTAVNEQTGCAASAKDADGVSSSTTTNAADPENSVGCAGDACVETAADPEKNAVPVKDDDSDPVADPAKDDSSDPAADPAKDDDSDPAADPAKDDDSDPAADPAKDDDSDPAADPVKDDGSDPAADSVKGSEKIPAASEETISADIPDPVVDETSDDVSEMEAALDAAVKSASKK